MKETPRDNGATSPLSTQPSSMHSTKIDTPEAPNTDLPRLHVDASSTARLVSEGDLPGVRLTTADDALFGVYQDWLHQNTGIHTDGGIDEDGKWKAI